MKPKQWLMDNGHIKEMGRGRMSKEHIALVTEAAKTTFIEGYSDGGVKPVTPAKVAQARPDGEKAIEELAPILYPHTDYVAIGFVDGVKKFATTKAACQEHGYSVCGHDCIGGTVNASKGFETFTISDYERV